MYRKADVYLLDDPLSAVDAHVGKHLFEQCIKTHLGSKTRILVTHQLQFIKDADLIIIFNNVSKILFKFSVVDKTVENSNRGNIMKIELNLFYVINHIRSWLEIFAGTAVFYALNCE